MSNSDPQARSSGQRPQWKQAEWPMAKMTPEQEASYALDFGVARSDLPLDAQLAYDRLVVQRAHAAATAPVSRADAAAAGRPCRPAEMGRCCGHRTGLPGGARRWVVLLPYACTRWQPGTPPRRVVVRAIGVAFIAAGAVIVLTG